MSDEGNVRTYEVGERRRRELSRALDLHQKDLEAIKDKLDARSLVAGVKEVNARLHDVVALKRQFGIQGDLLDDAPPPTPLEEEINKAGKGTGKGGKKDKGAPKDPRGDPPEKDTTVAWPDGTSSTVTNVLGYDANREAFEVIDSRGEARHIFRDPQSKEWRVLALVLEYPAYVPPSDTNFPDAPPDAPPEGSDDKPTTSAKKTAKKQPAARGGAPSPVGAVAATVAKKVSIPKRGGKKK